MRFEKWVEEACKSKKKKKKITEQLSVRDFELVDGFINQDDEFGVDAAISTVRDKVEDEMELIIKIATPDQMKNIKNTFKRFYPPFDKAMTALEGDPLNDMKYKKALKAFENLVKAYKKLV